MCSLYRARFREQNVYNEITQAKVKNMKNFAPLFLSQSYQDTWDDYIRSLSSETFPVWDYVILTASNEDQAEGYRMQIEQRKDYLPTATHFAVIPDEGGVRVGSGGATLSVIRYIYEQEKIRCGRGHFDNLRILVIHSGGDSKRVPTYSALGKLFSPVSHKLPDGRSSTLFDEFLIVMSSVPARIREGMLLLSGDVLLLFNPLQIDFSGRGAVAISFKENVETGKNHGVFLNGENNTVRKFLHKQTVETLTEAGAVNANHCVDIDTGAVIFSVEMLDALYSLVCTDTLYKKYVNDTVRLSLYGDFLYPLAEDSTLEGYYQEKPEGSFCPELHDARSVVWETLRPRIPEKKIVFDSRDMDVHGEFDTIEPLQATGDPYDPFALQKACLLACGVIPKEGGNLDEILTRLGGGFEMHSEVTNVPKGSGLGTSSILSAACVKAVFEFLGIEHTEADLYSHVLAMEQIMSTGGGWQDQIGGVMPGIKYITSRPGIRQELTVEHVEIGENTKKELNERFCLIYTRQRRFARNLLRDVVGRYVGNEPDSLYAMNEIQKVASLMRFELMRGNVDAFAELLEHHWELSKKVDVWECELI